MSSRSNDSQRLATLAQQISDIAAGCVGLTSLISSMNQDIGTLNRLVGEISDTLDELEKRLIRIERG
jgi:prefoldin subunit 5